MITRRRFVQVAAPLSLVVAGAGMQVRLLPRRDDVTGLERYSPLLDRAVASDATTAAVAEIGTEYLKQVPGAHDPLALLRELSSLDLRDSRGANPRSVARRLRDDVYARIQTDLRSGALLRLKGYFVTESLAKFCAAVFLASPKPG